MSVSTATETISDTDAYYLSVAESLGVPDGGRIGATALARAAGAHPKSGTRIVQRLMAAGLWRWADPICGGHNRVPDSVVLAAAEEHGGHPGRIAKAIGFHEKTVRLARKRLRAEKRWDWPDMPPGPNGSGRPPERDATEGGE